MSQEKLDEARMKEEYGFNDEKSYLCAITA